MNTPRIDELRRLEAAATPRPWHVADGARYVTTKPDEAGKVIARGNANGVENAALIAATRNALPLLLDVVEAAREYRYYPANVPFWKLDKALTALDGVASTGVESEAPKT
jgi:hypothetical protein